MFEPVRKTSNKGFSLIELLVVIAIIGLLSTLAVVALTSAKQKARDSKRLADVKQIQTALELYVQDSTNGYPRNTNLALGIDVKALCGTTGWANSSSGCGAHKTYMGLIPAPPTPADCSSYNDYFYTSTAANSYTITFCLGNNVGSLDAGPHTADTNGIK